MRTSEGVRRILDRVELAMRRGERFHPDQLDWASSDQAQAEADFQREVGLEIGAYAKRRRAFHVASRLLQGETNINEIATVMGYFNVEFLEEDFSEIFEINTDEYREQFVDPDQAVVKWEPEA